MEPVTNEEKLAEHLTEHGSLELRDYWCGDRWPERVLKDLRAGTLVAA